MSSRSSGACVSNTRSLAVALALSVGTSAWGQDARPAPLPALVPSDPLLVEATAGPLASPQSIPLVTGSSQSALPQLSSPAIVSITSIDQLLQMEPSALDDLYRRSPAAAVPAGKVKGRVLKYPGTRLAKPASRVARLVWQGKVFKGDEAMAVNRFFGLRMIEGRLYQGESWLDGGPALILDYQGTSRVYNAYRDEIREVGPGLYLGLMYERIQPQPKFKMYFALDARP